ncbi:MAG: BatA domain-containing protein [Planctomycetes bacterium]|nr:BatA domain-containing protein [Planctomycetota bacterium]
MTAQVAGLFTTGGLAAAGAAAITIPIAIHLLTRLRRRPQRWAAMRFLIEAYRRQRQRIQIEQLLLLIVRCLIVALLGLALSGPLLGGVARSLGIDAAGRTVFILIDDALSTQAQEPGSGARADRLRDTALRVVDSLGSADRVAVWSVARPMLTQVATPSPDRAAAREALTKLKPRHSRADWPAALSALQAEIKRLSLPPDRVTVVLVSDFSLSTLDTTRLPPLELSSLGSRAKLLVTRPMPSVSNTQISALVPRRSVALADATGVVVIEAELHLRRFGVEAPESLTGIDIAARPAGGGEPLAVARREVRWAAGQTETSLQIELKATLAALGLGDAAGANARGLTLEARIQDAGSSEPLPADGLRVALVEARRRLTVAVADEPATDRAEGSWFSRPRDWIEAALAPADANGHTDTGPIRLIDAPASSLDERTLRAADALLLLRPDLLNDAGWKTLRAWVEQGGFVWLFTPPSDAPATWTTRVTERLAPDWRLSLEPLHPVGAAESTWRLDGEHPVPEMMRLLSTDWPALVRPIAVSRRIALKTSTAQDTVWLRLADAGESDALLATTSLGDGRVMMLAAAIDPAWTNLPTKPLFVPLLHETLRGVIGSPGEAARLNAVVSGEQPTLGRRWDGVESVATPDGQTLRLKRTEGGVALLSPVDKPGVYASQPGAGLRFVVNPDADAGDTRALDEQAITRWLRPLGDWKWIDPANPLATVAAERPRADIGWPLLWVVLTLVLAETAMARWFSHATK